MPHHETELIAMLALGVVFAFACGLAAQRLRLPPIPGYLVAGIAIGPYTPGFDGDLELAGQIAELGVILLMFGVGLHFSVQDLLAVRRIAVPGAIAQIVTATAIGAVLAWVWGWGLGAGLVFGLTLSVASTVVLLRALDERNMLDTANGRIAVGWLVVEDLAMVLALVLLPAVAASLGDTGGHPEQIGAGALVLDLLITLVKVSAFVVIVLFVGRRAVPWLLRQAAHAGSRELFTLAVLAIALGIAYGSAELFGVSFAIGAFFAGVVLSESDLSHQAATESLPLQDAFAVLFFVSVGMLFDPSILIREPLSVLAVVLVIILGKSLASSAIVLALGYPVGTALTVSASLAQIGEFSFILAGLGVGLGLLPPEGRDLVLAGALLSISLNPAAFAIVARIERRLASRAGPAWPSGEDARAQRLSALMIEQPGCALSDHAVIVGSGRVGSTVAEAMRRARVPYVVIDRDSRRVGKLRSVGETVIFADAAAPDVLEEACADRARIIIITAPDGYEARRVLERAREVNPGGVVLVRAQNDAERAHLEEHGASRAIAAEPELALSMAEDALARLGVAGDTTSGVLEELRNQASARDEIPEMAEPVHGAPELRSHQKRPDEGG